MGFGVEGKEEIGRMPLRSGSINKRGCFEFEAASFIFVYAICLWIIFYHKTLCIVVTKRPYFSIPCTKDSHFIRCIQGEFLIPAGAAISGFKDLVVISNVTSSG